MNPSFFCCLKKMSKYELAVKNLKYTEDDLPNLSIINLKTVIEAFQFDSSSGLEGDMKKAYEHFLKWGASVKDSLVKLQNAAKARFVELKTLLRKGAKTDGKQDLQPLKNKMTNVLMKMQKALKQFGDVKSMKRAESVLSNAKYRGLQDDVEDIAELMNRLNYLHVETSFTKDLIDVMKLVRLVLFKLRSDSLVLEYISGKVQECEGSEDFSALLEALERMEYNVVTGSKTTSSKDKETNIQKSKDQKASADKRKRENESKQKEKKAKNSEFNDKMKELKEEIRTASTEDKAKLEVKKKELIRDKEKREGKSPKKKQKSEKPGKTGPPKTAGKETKKPAQKVTLSTGLGTSGPNRQGPRARAEDLVSNLIHYEF